MVGGVSKKNKNGYNDDYEVKGKFTSKTGGNTTKAKAQSKGYKGKTVTGDPSKDKSESTTSAKAKAASTADLTQYVKDEQKYEEAVASGTENDSWVQGKDYWKDQEGKIYTDVHARNLADYDISKAKEKATSVADLQLEADINTALNKEEFRDTEESYLTNYSGTAGDSYYKNEQGTGTGQGGSGTGYGTGSNTYTYTGNDKTTDTDTTTQTTKDEATPTTTSVDMSSDGDENKPSQKASSATNTGGGGGTATDMEEIAELPQKLKSAYRRRAKRKGKRDLRVQKDTGLNIPASSSGLSIPT